MDLSISRLGRAKLNITNRSIALNDGETGKTLLELTNRPTNGDYAVVIFDTNRRQRRIMRIRSTYDFETLNREQLLSRLNAVLAMANIKVLELALFYRREDDCFLGEKAVTLHRRNATYFCHNAAVA